MRSVIAKWDQLFVEPFDVRVPAAEGNFAAGFSVDFVDASLSGIFSEISKLAGRRVKARLVVYLQPRIDLPKLAPFDEDPPEAALEEFDKSKETARPIRLDWDSRGGEFKFVEP